jgi:hypothetical protein
MCRALCLILLLACGTVSAQTEKDRPAKGSLTDTLIVMDLQDTVGGYMGKKWVLESTGRWQLIQVSNLRETVVQTGQLADKDLAALVQQLDKYDLRALVKRAATRPTPAPHQIMIRLGLDEVELRLPAEGELPRADPKTREGRFIGILDAVRKGLVEKRAK